MTTGGLARTATVWLTALALAFALVAQTGRALDRLRASKQVRVVEVVGAQVVAVGRVPPQISAGNFRLLRQARELDPAGVAPLMGLGSQYLLMGRPDAAIEAYLQALAFEPRPEIYLNLGRAYVAAGQRAEAERAFGDALLLAPGLRDEVPAGYRPPTDDSPPDAAEAPG